jgi:hypothetical protein
MPVAGIPQLTIGRASTIPVARLRLRLQAPEGRPMVLQGWARMETADHRAVEWMITMAWKG